MNGRLFDLSEYNEAIGEFYLGKSFNSPVPKDMKVYNSKQEVYFDDLNRQYFIFIDSHLQRVYSENQVCSDVEIYYRDGTRITDKELLKTYDTEKNGSNTKSFIRQEGKKVQVFLPRDNHCLFDLDGRKINDFRTVMNRTMTVENGVTKYWVEQNSIQTEVFQFVIKKLPDQNQPPQKKLKTQDFKKRNPSIPVPPAGIMTFPKDDSILSKTAPLFAKKDDQPKTNITDKEKKIILQKDLQDFLESKISNEQFRSFTDSVHHGIPTTTNLLRIFQVKITENILAELNTLSPEQKELIGIVGDPMLTKRNHIVISMDLSKVTKWTEFFLELPIPQSRRSYDSLITKILNEIKPNQEVSYPPCPPLQQQPESIYSYGLTIYEDATSTLPPPLSPPLSPPQIPPQEDVLDSVEGQEFLNNFGTPF